MKTAIIVALLSSVSCAGAQSIGPSICTYIGDMIQCGGSISVGPGLPRNQTYTDLANWHLFTQSQGGTVSLLHGLTKAVCEKARNFTLSWRFSTLDIDAVGNYVAGGRSGSIGPNTIIRAECFQ